MSNNPKTEITSHFSQNISGRYKIQIIDRDKNVVWEQPHWQKNLILNQGMDNVASSPFADNMTWAFGGTGTRTNSIPGGDSSGSVATNVLTLVPSGDPNGLQSFTASVDGYANALQIGDVVVFNNGQQVSITGVSNLTASLAASTTVALQPFTIWKVSQAGLQTVHQSTNNIFFGNADGTYCGTTVSNNLTTLMRTWDFAYETSSITYTEVGVGSGASNSNVFSRILLPLTQSIAANQALRMLYQMDIYSFPTASSPGTPGTASISGWPVAPATDTGFFYNLQLPGVLSSWISIISNTGQTQEFGIDPASSVLVFVSNQSASAANYNSTLSSGQLQGTVNATVNASAASYTLGSYTVFKTATYDVTQINANNIHTMGVSNASAPGAVQPFGNCAFLSVFNQGQTKTNIQTLSLTFVWTWSRVLA
jgi:hypothetical protein